MKTRLLSLALASAFAAVCAQAQIIYQETFGGSSATSLNTLAPTVNNSGASVTWSGSANFKADGSIAASNSGLWLPITLSLNTDYQLTTVFDTTSGAGGNWLTQGFAAFPEGASGSSFNNLTSIAYATLGARRDGNAGT